MATETGTIPYSQRKNPRPRFIDPDIGYLLQRWQQGCQSGAQLARELRAKGYTGSDHGIYRYLETLKVVAPAPSRGKRASKRAGANLSPALLTLSPSQASLSLFPPAGGFQAARARAPPTVETGKPLPGSHLSARRSIFAHGTFSHRRTA